MLISIALVVALVGAMFGFFFDMLSSRARALEHVRQHDVAAALIKQLDADLMSCVAGDGEGGSGLAGDGTSLRVLSRGVAASLAPRGIHHPSVLGDLQFTQIRWSERSKQIEIRRGPSGEGDGENASAFTALDGVIHKLRLRYHDGQSWRESFDSAAAGALPTAVELAMWFNPLPGEDEQADAAVAPADEELGHEPAPGNFDERAYALQSDLDLRDQRPPDRVRLFIVPDAGVEGASEAAP